jgi:2-dehydropantoate 2-reductase
MGCRFGDALHRHGEDVTLLDGWPEHVAAIREHGLQVRGELGNHTSRIPAVTFDHAGELQSADLVIVFGKALQTAAIAQACRRLITDTTRMLTLQNGLGNVEVIEEVVPRERILAGVTTLGTELIGPGVIRALGTGHTYIAKVDGGTDRLLEQIVRAMAEAGLEAEYSPDVNRIIWAKVAFNCVLNTLSALIRVPVGRLSEYPQLDQLVSPLVDEVVAVAAADGVALKASEVHTLLEDALDTTRPGSAHHLPSMLQDLLNGRPTEIDHLNGAVVSRGAQLGVPTPVNATLTHLIRLSERLRKHQVPATTNIHPASTTSS